MKGYHSNIEDLTLVNENFRQVLFTGKHMQLVLMTLKPNEDIGMEVHETVDQFFRFEAGEGKVVIDGEETIVKDGDVAIVPAGSQHNIINTPPNHPEGTIHKTKEEAMKAEEEHH
jgi:mannose-6-phosphate isomerase-like protein (cupin superfamily)